MSRKRKVVFSEEDKEELRKAYDEGMNGVGREKDGMICRIATKLNRESTKRSRYISWQIYISLDLKH